MVVPHIGLQFDWTPVTHFIRDLLFAYILYQVGYREAHAAFATMLIAGFWEAGNGVCYNQDAILMCWIFYRVYLLVFSCWAF